MSNWVEILPLALVVVIFWLLIVRPQRARQRAIAATQSQLSSGNKVMLASGLYGEIVTVGDDTIELRIAPSTVVVVARQAVARVIEPETTAVDLDKGTDA